MNALASVDKLSRTTNSVLRASSGDISTTLTELEFIEQLVLSGPNFVNSFGFLMTFQFPPVRCRNSCARRPISTARSTS